MGGAVSELRAEIRTHVLIMQRYAAPSLDSNVCHFVFLLAHDDDIAVQYFLRTAETGEGTNHDRPIDEIPANVVISDKRIFEEASTEVELLVENVDVVKVLLTAIRTHKQLQWAPDLDPFKRWYDPPWHKQRLMPKYLELSYDELPRYQIAVLRASIRCLRLMVVTADARQQMEDAKGPELLNQVVQENPLDDFLKKDVKAIFSAIYGGENAVKRIVIGNVPVVVELMNENRESAIVQLAGVKRLCQLLVEVQARSYSPSSSSPTATTKLSDTNSTSLDKQRQELFADLDSLNVVTLVTETLNRFDVDAYLGLYIHVCRFISFVAIEEHNTKLIAQAGGIEGSIRLLFKAREMHRQRKDAQREEAAREARRLAAPHAEWSSILEINQPEQTPPPAPPTDSSGAIASLSSLAAVDFTPTEIGQQAMWALDLLSTLDFNVSMMKLHKLKYLLEEIRLDPDAHELGSALIITRRLRLIRWDQIGVPPTSPTKSKGKND